MATQPDSGVRSIARGTSPASGDDDASSRGSSVPRGLCLRCPPGDDRRRARQEAGAACLPRVHAEDRVLPRELRHGEGVHQDEGTRECRAKQAAEARKHRDAPGDPTFCQRTLVTVRGPYPRSGYDGNEDDKVLFVYKGSDGGWYDKTGESPCFAAGTPIATPSGEKAIESIAVGEAVYSWDAEAKEVVVGAVTRTKRRAGKRVGTLTFEDGRTVDVTGNHPFYVVRTGEWVEAARLEPGTVVLELRNGAVAETRLVAKAEFAREAVVYDLTVTTHHDYFAAGVLVHNY